jgi:hypothetical protein
MIIAFQELVLAFLDRIGQAPGSPTLFMNNFRFSGGNESLDSLPSLTSLIGTDHRA